MNTAAAYLLLVSFLTGQFTNLQTAKLQNLNNSPYNGVAIPLVSAYDTAHHQYAEFAPAIASLRATVHVDVWPWIYWNRMVGYDPTHGLAHEGGGSARPYFERIKGMDIYDRTGSVDEFYNLFRIALQIARTMNSPGIIVDPEAYNDYHAETVPDLVTLLHVSPQAIHQRCEFIGGRLADFVAATYPNAVLWFTFTGIGHPKGGVAGNDRAITFVVEGLLQRAKQLRLRMRVVDGGEIYGYCYSSLNQLEKITTQRKAAVASWQNQYPNLYLAGTITPWIDPQSRRGWLREGDCRNSGSLGGASFTPLLEYMSRTYPYVWIYAAMDSDYNPYKPQSAMAMNPVLRQGFSKTSRSLP